MFVFLASTTLAGEGTWHKDAVLTLMWFMAIGKDMQQIILSVRTGNTRKKTKFHEYFFARRLIQPRI